MRAMRVVSRKRTLYHVNGFLQNQRLVLLLLNLSCFVIIAQHVLDIISNVGAIT